jgi:hypothetical protein
MLQVPVGISYRTKSAVRTDPNYLVMQIWDEDYDINYSTEFAVNALLNLTRYASINLVANELTNNSKLNIHISSTYPTSADATFVKNTIIPYGKKIAIDVEGEYLTGLVEYSFNDASYAPNGITVEYEISQSNHSRIVISNLFVGSSHGSIKLVAKNNYLSSEPLMLYYFGSYHTSSDPYPGFSVIAPYNGSRNDILLNNSSSFVLSAYNFLSGVATEVKFTQPSVGVNAYSDEDTLNDFA